MKMKFFNVSFKGVDTTSKNKKSFKQNKNMSSPRYSEMNKYRRNEPIIDKYDNGSPRTQETFGVAYPTPYDFCYDRMSFEKDDETVGLDIFRDAEYEDELKSTHSYNRKGKFADTTIEDLQYRYQNYSYDDIPLSESLLRQEHGFYETPYIEIDTDIDDEELKKLDAINYRENIIPAALKCETEDLWEFASEAACFKHAGYSSQTIARALERCFLTSVKDGQKKPNIELFSFLVEHPNLRPDVLAKHPKGGAVFDKAFANNFKIFSEYYFNNEESIKYALNLCKTKDGEFNLVSKELCEIVGLLRRKTAQGLPYVHNPRYDYEGIERNKFEKYVAKGTPLTPNDVKLINKLKPKGRLDADAFEVTKQLFSVGNVSVPFVLENIDKLVSRKKEIAQIKTDLIDKYTDSNISSINRIKYVLNFEYQDLLLEHSHDLTEKSILFDTTKKLIDESVDVQNIAILLERLQDIQARVPLNTELVAKFISLFSEVSGNGVFCEKWADIMAKIVILARGIRDVDVEIISLLKENKSNDPEFLGLVNHMLDGACNINSVYSYIKEKIVANKVANEQNKKNVTENSDRAFTDKASNLQSDNTLHSTKNTNGNKKLNEVINLDERYAALAGKLFSTRGYDFDPVSAGEIISIIHANSKDKQRLLETVKGLLDKGCSNKQILDAITENEQLVQDTTVAHYDENYISKLVNERLSDEQIKAVDERIEKDLAKKQTENKTNSSASKPDSSESYMSKLIRERLSTEQVNKVNERIDNDLKLTKERNHEALKSLDKKSSVSKPNDVKVDEEYVLNRLKNVPSWAAVKANIIIAKITQASKEEKQILIKVVNNMLNNGASCDYILCAILARN